MADVSDQFLVLSAGICDAFQNQKIPDSEGVEKAMKNSRFAFAKMKAGGIRMVEVEKCSGNCGGLDNPGVEHPAGVWAFFTPKEVIGYFLNLMKVKVNPDLLQTFTLDRQFPEVEWMALTLLDGTTKTYRYDGRMQCFLSGYASKSSILYKIRKHLYFDPNINRKISEFLGEGQRPKSGVNGFKRVSEIIKSGGYRSINKYFVSRRPRIYITEEEYAKRVLNPSMIIEEKRVLNPQIAWEAPDPQPLEPLEIPLVEVPRQGCCTRVWKKIFG